MSLLLAQSTVDRVLGLDALSVFDADVTLGWRYPLPLYVWVGILLAAAGWAAWTYGGLLGSRQMRALLAGLRAALIVLLAVLLAGPMLVRPGEIIEPDWLLVLVDRSASMQVQDMPPPPERGPGAISRDAAMRLALEQQAPALTVEPGNANRRVAWIGFGEQTFDVPPADAAAQYPPADAPHTYLRTAIDQALQRVAGQPVSGVVLLTDGRSPQATGPELVRRLQQQGAAVFSVPLGAAELPLDLAISVLDAPRQAFVEDIVPITVLVDRLGGDAPPDPADVTLRLVDTVTGEVLDETTLAQRDRQIGEPVRLTGRSDVAGPVNWRVEVALRQGSGSGDQGSGEQGDGSALIPDPGSLSPELVTSNNLRSVTVDLIDRPVRVLYIEGYPRWEYRYLANMLLREETISSSMLLLSADRAFVQEGDVPITRPPRTAEEMREYDVIILGDVPASYFTPGQLALIRDHVASLGAGLLWIGGERHMPGDFAGTPLADLLPMRQPSAVGRAAGEPLAALVPTELAEDLAIMQLRAPGVGIDDWPDDLPPLYWVQDIAPLKPTADVLAIDPTRRTSEGLLPLVTRLRYGAGQSLYVGTDETWRWRYGRGEIYFEQFWLQLIRLLGRGRVAQSADRAQLTVSSRRIGVGEPVVVELRSGDAALIARELPRIRVAVSPRADGAAIVDELELRPVPGDAEGQSTYRTTWSPTVAGDLRLLVTEPGLDDLGIEAMVEVSSPDDELRQVEPDHDRLIALAEQTGGAVVDLADLHRIPQLAPNRAVKTPNDLREPLWHSGLALTLILSLLTAEWVMRKVIRLV